MKQKPYHQHDCEKCIHIDSTEITHPEYKDKYDFYIHLKDPIGMSDIIMRHGVDGDYYCKSLDHLLTMNEYNAIDRYALMTLVPWALRNSIWAIK